MSRISPRDGRATFHGMAYGLLIQLAAIAIILLLVGCGRAPSTGSYYRLVEKICADHGGIQYARIDSDRAIAKCADGARILAGAAVDDHQQVGQL